MSDMCYIYHGEGLLYHGEFFSTTERFLFSTTDLTDLTDWPLELLEPLNS